MRAQSHTHVLPALELLAQVARVPLGFRFLPPCLLAGVGCGVQVMQQGVSSGLKAEPCPRSLSQIKGSMALLSRH